MACLLAAIVLAVIGAARAAGRPFRGAGNGGSPQTANPWTARLTAQEPGLLIRLAVAANTPPLLTALANHVDGPTLADLFRSQDWWRDVRSDFEMTRVIVGAQILTTEGSVDLGAGDRDVVAEARRRGVASTVVVFGGHPYAVVVRRLATLPDKVPVLVLAKMLDDGSARRRSDAFVLFALAAAGVLGGAGLLLAERRSAARARAAGPGLSSLDLDMAPPPDVAAKTPRAYPRHPTAPDGTPVTSDGAPGQPFGRYQLLNRLGEGGMSEVFTAVAHGAEGFSRVFVLKRLRHELARDQVAVAQFVDEARLQASLVHSNIVPVFDFGRVGDQYFMTQEYIVGRDIARVIASVYQSTQQTLNPRLAHYLAHETLRALHYAHTRRDRDGQPLGIVHRDVSTSNIILSAEGEVKLADFGIVKSNKRISRTQAGTVKGNANFMSPEQARGQEVDARSDVFSLGLVLHYMLTNRLIYDGDNDLDVLFKAASGPPIELARQLDRLPSPAREALTRALSFDPENRFQTAAEFADILAPHVGGAKAEAAELMQQLFGRELETEAA